MEFYIFIGEYTSVYRRVYILLCFWISDIYSCVKKFLVSKDKGLGNFFGASPLSSPGPPPPTPFPILLGIREQIGARNGHKHLCAHF
jgi:hypothetical protein